MNPHTLGTFIVLPDQQCFFLNGIYMVYVIYLYITYMFVVIFYSLAQASDFRIEGDKLSSSAECRILSWEVWDTKSPADWMPTHKPAELSRIKLKTWTQQPVPMIMNAFIGLWTAFTKHTLHAPLLIGSLWKSLHRHRHHSNTAWHSPQNPTSSMCWWH